MGGTQGLLPAPCLPSESSSASIGVWAGLCTWRVVLRRQTQRCGRTCSHYPGNLGRSHWCNKVGDMEEKGKHQPRRPTGRKRESVRSYRVAADTGWMQG